MAGYQIPNWDKLRGSQSGGTSTASSMPLNTGFANQLIRNISPLLNPGAQDALANQQWQAAHDNTVQEIGNSNQHLAEQWAARTGRSLNGGGGVSVRADLDKQRLDPALAGLEQNRIAQQMQQRNMLSGFAPALLAMQQRQAEFAYQQRQDEQARRDAAANAARQQMAPRHVDSTYGLFGTGSGTAPMSGGGGFAGGGGDAGWGEGFGQLGSERGIWNAPKTQFGVITSGNPSAIKPTAFNTVSQGLSTAGHATQQQQLGNSFANAAMNSIKRPM